MTNIDTLEKFKQFVSDNGYTLVSSYETGINPEECFKNFQDFVDSCDSNIEKAYLFLNDSDKLDVADIVNEYNSISICKSVIEATMTLDSWVKRGVKNIYFNIDSDLGEQESFGGTSIGFVSCLISEYCDKGMNFKFHFPNDDSYSKLMADRVKKFWEVE